MQNTPSNPSYSDLIKLLALDTVISLVIMEDPSKFRRKLSMAKHREGIDGTLDFDIETLSAEYVKENYGTEVVAHSITVVLVPPKKPGILSIGSVKTGDL